MNSTSQIGSIINQKYQLIEVLGKGGWGITYLAEDLHNQKKVALKAFTLNRLSDWKQVELFEREAKVLESLKHRAIPSYLEYFTVDTADNRCFYLAQELAPGKSLANWVKEGWRATESEVKQIAEQLLAILIYLHDQKPPIIHRDLKPDNIIRQADNKIFLVDFGAVKNTYYSTIARSSTVVGTYGYIAPEQFIGQAKPASDLYSLGATILFLLTHVSPAELSTDNLQIKFRNRVNISDDFADWLETMLEPEIENRFGNAKTALTVLKGKQNNPLKTNHSISPKTLKITVEVLALAVLILANSFKWGILSRLGIVPENICESKVMTKYLKQGGDPNAWRNSFDDSFPIVKCLADVKDSKTLKLFINRGGDINLGYRSIPWSAITSPQSALILFEHIKKSEKFSDLKKQEITLQLLSNSEEIALLLIERGADINVRDRFDNTILHKTQFQKIASLAINAGINVDVKNKYGTTPLHYGNSIEVVELLIDSRADVNVKNGRNSTPLHLANNHLIAQALISSGADLTSKDNQGNTPIHLHSASNYKIAQVLINKNINPNTKNNQGQTPLHLVDYHFIAQALVDLGADLLSKDNQGNTPLHSTSNPKVASTLIKNGVSPNIVNSLGLTKLHLICMSERGGINLGISLLMAGADVDFRNNEKRTALHLAVINEHDNSFIELLLQAGANINLKDNEGKTPFDYAKIHQNQRLINLLNSYSSNNTNY